MKLVWFILVPIMGFSPVVIRYLRIQGNTNPFLKEVYTHTTGNLAASFVPMGPIQDILKDTVYECVENRTILAEYFAKQLLIQFISHEINDGVHEVLKKITH